MEEELSGSLVETIEGIELVIEAPSRFFGLSRIAGVGLDFVLGALVNAIIFGFVLYMLIMIPVFIRRMFQRRQQGEALGPTEKAATKKQA